jgi:hypothetical protein
MQIVWCYLTVNFAKDSSVVDMTIVFAGRDRRDHGANLVRMQPL